MIKKIITDNMVYHKDRDDVLKSRDLNITYKFMGIKLFNHQATFESSISDERLKNSIGFNKDNK